VLATPETECTLAKVLSFVEAEESVKYSLSDSKLFDSVSGVSSFKRQQGGGGVGKTEVNPPKPATAIDCKCTGQLGGNFQPTVQTKPVISAKRLDT
jgi:hypothetical protein